MERSSLEVISKGVYDFTAMLTRNNLSLPPISVDTLWANITYRCNQTCVHCHVAASPDRTEEMSRSTIDQCLYVLAYYDSLNNLDITGGAPELNPHFEHFVVEARKLNKHVIVRHNLTVTTDGNTSTGKKMTHLPDFFADNQVEIIASLPNFNQSHTDQVRGIGVFEKSIEAMRRLNKLGYGQNTGLVLNLVYNHDGPLLPTDRDELEVSAFSPAAAMQLVCRSLLSVGYDGRLYDCDFNQMLDMQITVIEPLTIFNFDLQTIIGREIRFGSHCFGCTSGGGSS